MASARTPRGARREAIAARGGPEGQGAGPEPTPSRGGAGAGGGARRAQARGAAASQRDGRVGAGQEAAARTERPFCGGAEPRGFALWALRGERWRLLQLPWKLQKTLTGNPSSSDD